MQWCDDVKPTDHGLYDGLGHLDQLLVDLNRQVTQHLSVLCQVEIFQTVFVLFWSVLSHEGLDTKIGSNQNDKICILKTKVIYICPKLSFTELIWEMRHNLAHYHCETLTSSPLYCFRQ